MDGKYNNYGADSKSSHADEPPNSRLFIIGNKRLNESDFRDAFSQFGEIEDIWVVKDRSTGENKGVTYIKYSKTSEAANALETMNGKTIAGCERNIKVMIASNRNKGSYREDNEDEKIYRLFVLIPKSMTEEELEDYFRQFGDIDYVNIVKDKETRESKGFAYIKYLKFSHAARAFEECDRKYKAVFSEPRKSNMSRYNNDYQMNNDNRMGGGQGQNYGGNQPYVDNSYGDKYYKVMVVGSPQLTEEQIWKLFSVVPGMEYCQVRFDATKRRTTGMVMYSSLQWASHAVEKLNGFEYPIGSRLVVKPYGTVPRPENNRPMARPNNNMESPNLRQLAETLAQATSIIQNAGLSPVTGMPTGMPTGGGMPTGMQMGGNMNNQEVGELCNVKLPNPQPLASVDAETEARCFIVCTPPPPCPSVLRDIFCRFGNLIDVYMLANRNCGYAKYAVKESAIEAIKVLHGAEVYGRRMKVLEAEERDYSRKRLRLDDQ